MRILTIILLGGIVPLASCQSAGEPKMAVPASLGAEAEPNGKFLAEALCSGCHAVEVGQISPNPASPSFESIANRKGLTRETLGEFLHDSYNFPNQMELEVSDEDSEAISSYILMLRDSDR